MALYRLLENSALLPEDIKRMAEAYESVLSYFHLPSGDNPANQTIAQSIIECAQTGEKDPWALRAAALNRMAKAA